MLDEVVIAGGGIVGLSTAIGLAQFGYKVIVYEKRDPIDKASLYSIKRSLKLDISYRGQIVFDRLGVLDDLVKHAIILNKRTYHTEYGPVIVDTDKKRKGFYSVSHSKIWQILLNKSQQYNNIEVIFNHEVIDLDHSDLSYYVHDHSNKKTIKRQASLLIACDGVNSKIREILSDKNLISYRERAFLGFYKEVQVSDTSSGNLDLNSTHFWFKKSGIMLVVHPTTEEHLEGHLFLDKSLNNQYNFADLNTIEKASLFLNDFQGVNIDPGELISNPIGKINVIDEFNINSVNPNLFFLGDSLHSMVPFLGQGVNCGLEDCYVFLNLIQQHNYVFKNFNKLYHEERIKNSNSIVEMSLKNAPEFSGDVLDNRIMINRFLDNFLKHKHDWYVPFTDLIYFTTMSFIQIEEIRSMQREMLNSISVKFNWIDDIDYTFVEDTLNNYKKYFLNISHNINNNIQMPIKQII